jgi:2-phosphosulfolactate phosphatase
MQQKNLEVCLSPALLHLYDIKDSIVVVIDIFRATSSMCYGIANGAEAIIPVATVEACRSYEHTDFLLAAERNGEVVEGFDFGNSPFSYTSEKVAGKTVVITTTNGTHAINESRSAQHVVVGSFLNLTAITNWLKTQPHHVLLLCAGWKNKVNLEDSLFAGAVAYQLQNEGYKFDDSAILTADLYQMAQGNLDEFLKKTSHSERLKQLKIEADIAFCLQVDLIDVIPVLDGDRLVRLV